MAGRKPKPTAIKKLEGNPGKRKLNTQEPIPAKGMPECPEWLMPEAKKEWERLADLMNQMGVRRHIGGGANRTLISAEIPRRSCRIGTCRRLSAGLPQIVAALFERQLALLLK